MAALGQTRGAMALVVTLFFHYGGSCPGSRGLAWGWQDLLMGLCFIVIFGDAALELHLLHFIPNGGSSVTIPNR